MRFNSPAGESGDSTGKKLKIQEEVPQMNYKLTGYIFSIIILFFFSVGVLTAYEATGWSVGFANYEGQYRVEFDDGSAAQITGDVALAARYWINSDDALRIVGSLDTADGPGVRTNTFNLGLAYLTHFGAGPYRPFVGGGVYFADDIDGSDNLFSLDGLLGVHWSPPNFPLSFVASTDLVSLVVEPDSNFYVAKILAFEVLYTF